MNLKKLFSTVILTSSLMFSANTFALTADDELQLEEAQKRLESAARAYAELAGSLKDDDAKVIVKSFKFPDDLKMSQTPSGSKARLGIQLGQVFEQENENGEVTSNDSNKDGVSVFGVSKDSPAQAAGLKEGDLITALNGMSLVTTDNTTALEQLLKAMKDVKPGERVDVDYLRDGKSYSTGVITDAMPKMGEFVFNDFLKGFSGDMDVEIFTGDNFEWLEKLEGLENLEGLKGLDKRGYSFFPNRFTLGDAELVELSPELGSYFDAKQGILVVKAPSDDSIDLRDGDVITSIDGREVTSVGQTMRILRSYKENEEVKFNIKRKKRDKTLSMTMPEHQGAQQFRFDIGSDGKPLDRLKLRKKILETVEENKE